MTELETAVAVVDDNELSADAVRVADLLANPGAGGRVFAVHAIPSIPAPLAQILFPYASLGDDADAIHAELVSAAGKRLFRRIKAHVAPEHFSVVHGPPVHALLAETERIGPTITVAVTPPAPRAHGFHLGDVCGGLARGVSGELLLARPLEGREPRLNRLLAAVDLTDDSVHVLRRALDLAHRHGGQVQPVFVAPALSDLDQSGLVADERGISARAKKDVTNRWTQIEAALELTYPIASQAKSLLRPKVITVGDPATKLSDLARETDADLVILGRGRTGGSPFGRVAEYVARNAPAHVLLVSPPSVEPGG